MYESFFKLSRRPFPSVPTTAFYYPAEGIDEARVKLTRTIERAEGVGLVIGAAGTGKSLLCELLAEHFREMFSVAMLSSARLCSRRALLKSILFELRLPYRERDEGELRLSLMDFLEPSERCPHGMLLIIDEAQTLPIALLEEIRLITNLVRGGTPRVRLLLAGTSLLEERLASPKLQSFQQRISARCYLHALTKEETAAYVREQLRAAGGNADTIFVSDAYRVLHQVTDGVPRLINQVCDHAMILACAGGRRRIDGHGIEESWSDLQQLPAPRLAPARGANSSIVEFSVLGDDDTFDEEAPSDTDDSWEFEDAASVEMGGDRPEGRSVGSWDVDAASDADDAAAGGEPGEGEQGEPSEIEHVAAEQGASHGDGDTTPVTVVNPFGGPFADEEVVLDRFADWRDLPRVTIGSRAVNGNSTSVPQPAFESREAAVHSPPTAGTAVNKEADVSRGRDAPDGETAAEDEWTMSTAELLAIWSQPVFAGTCAPSHHGAWPTSAVVAGNTATRPNPRSPHDEDSTEHVPSSTGNWRATLRRA